MSHEPNKCAKCNVEITDKDSEHNKIHEMIHMLIDQLNKMPPEYGAVAMMQLLIEHCPYTKDAFLQTMSDSWDNWKVEKK